MLMTGNSGTNFNRPQFKQMISDIEDGKIDIVITKDLSRLGREYLQTGSYIEIFFPANNVRYIAVNDGVDTATGDNEFLGIKNIINEFYAKDISKKIRSARKTLAKQGKYTAPFAPYGYKKDPENKHHLLVDENTAPVVKRMFQMAMEKEKHLPRSPRFSLQKKY
jgi:site-specific recombinases, DNA invertase pin homologs